MTMDPAQARVMVVDDEPENLNVLEASLSHAGYRVWVFPRGELALAAAQTEAPDLALLDIQMPGMDGYELCRRFKADERLGPVPILFMSALTAAEDIATGFECGGVDYIAKPFRESEVLARVRTHLALRGTYKQLALQHDQLRILERHRDTLVHMLVHDMRNPLQVILGHLYLLRQVRGTQQSGVEDLDNLEAAIRGTRLLGEMVSTVVDLSRMESAAIPLHRVTVPVQEIFQAARVQSLDPSRAHRIADHIAESCPLLLCDVGLSVRILINLFANAFKYSPPGGAIEFGAAPDPCGVRLWVRDRGPGIPAHEHPGIFEKFGVSSQPVDTRLPSTGLGLAFCKLAVEAQGGTIGVVSEIGKGSTFWFTLPPAP
jgi:signal transduction histidine kinase